MRPVFGEVLRRVLHSGGSLTLTVKRLQLYFNTCTESSQENKYTLQRAKKFQNPLSQTFISMHCPCGKFLKCFYFLHFKVIEHVSHDPMDNKKNSCITKSATSFSRLQK